MTYISAKILTVDQFVTQYSDDSRYELADGELIDRSPTGPHEAVGGKPKRPAFTVCQLEGEEYRQHQYRLGKVIVSGLLPDLQLRLDDVLPL